MKHLILTLSLAFSVQAFAQEIVAINFDLMDVKGSTSADGECVEKGPLAPIAETFADDKFWSTQEKEKDGGVYVKVTKKIEPKEAEEAILPLGMSNREALYMSRDHFNTTVFSEGHDQGDMANRWSHSYLARIPGEILKRNGVPEVVASVVGALFFVPKEFLYDLHPSSGDLVVTYTDKLGTKSSQFQVTVFGDAIYKHRPFEDVKPFKESAPFVTWRRKF